MTDHLGYDRHDPTGRNSGNSRNGTRTKTVLTDNCGPVEIEVPRDRNGSFDPTIVGRWQRRIGAVDTLLNPRGDNGAVGVSRVHRRVHSWIMETGSSRQNVM